MFINKKYRRPINLLIKVAATLYLCVLLYKQVWMRENVHELWNAFYRSFQSDNLHWLLLAFFSMPINWGFEALKWQKITSSFANLSLWTSIKATYAGAMVGIFTPNRVGEFGGKILWLSPEQQGKGVVVSFVGSGGQFIAILLGGGPAVLYFLHQIYPEIPSFWFLMLLGGEVLLLFVLLFLFYNVELVIKMLRRFPIPRFAFKYLEHVKVLKNYSVQDLSWALWYSILRYVVYALQYYWMLRFFDIDVTVDVGIAGIATVFLFQTIVPLPSLAGLLVRGELAIQVWGFFTDNHINILATTFGLWLINVILPALIGWIFIINKNVIHSLGYDEEPNVRD